MKFSTLTDGFALPTNRLYAERAALLAKRVPVLDLVSGQGAPIVSPYPQAAFERALKMGGRKTIPYRPHPKGALSARKAIQRFYLGERLSVSDESILLTPGTSLSYWYLFKLLADAGDEILSPQPSYPLFESIARISGVSLVPYPLDETRDWAIDLVQLEAAITPRTRAIILVSPHNPTGSVADPKTLDGLAEITARHRLAIISDEVFSPFLFQPGRLPRPASTRAPLVFTLNGFSKMFALPGMKIGWIVTTGDPALVQSSLAGLEMISDTFLPVQEAAQGAVPAIFAGGKAFSKRYQAAVRAQAARCVADIEKIEGLSMVAPQGGFYATVRLEGMDEEDCALQLLKKFHLLVHPGYFYDISGQHLVFSFAQSTTALRQLIHALQKITSNR